MFGLGGFGLAELLIIAAIVLLLFGARHLPGIGAELGRTARKIRDGLSPKKVEDIELPDDLYPREEGQKRPNQEK